MAGVSVSSSRHLFAFCTPPEVHIHFGQTSRPVSLVELGIPVLGSQLLKMPHAGPEGGDGAASALKSWRAQQPSTAEYTYPEWHVIEGDVRTYSAAHLSGIELLAGGVPCPPFSHAGKQLGADDERDLFPEALRLVEECRPLGLMLENVRGLLDPRFAACRENILTRLKDLGYEAQWRLLQASDYGVPQLRPRSILVALRNSVADHFQWPEPKRVSAPTVGDRLHDLMAANGWEGAASWRDRAQAIAPTLVGGSKKHGGPDLGPTRARKAWASLGVDGRGLADSAPLPGFEGDPRLTIRMAARIQGFPDTWELSGKKTAAYRQVGNAFPPPVAQAVGQQIAAAFESAANAKIQRRA